MWSQVKLDVVKLAMARSPCLAAIRKLASVAWRSKAISGANSPNVTPHIASLIGATCWYPGARNAIEASNRSQEAHRHEPSFQSSPVGDRVRRAVDGRHVVVVACN